MTRHPFKQHMGKGRAATAKRSTKPAPSSAPKRYVLRIDHRTIITVTGTKAVEFWRKRYPNLTIVS